MRNNQYIQIYSSTNAPDPNTGNIWAHQTESGVKIKAPINGSYVDLINGDGLKTSSKTISGAINELYDRQSVAGKPLEMLKQMFYRNLEGDNRLPLLNYSGRTRPVQTPIILLSVTGLKYRVKNMPNVRDFVTNPTHWMFFQHSGDWLTSARHAVKITQVEYLGTVGSDTNVADITLNETFKDHNGNSWHQIGGHVFIASHMAHGLKLRYDIAFQNRQSVRLWDRSLSGINLVWKHPVDGKFRCMLHGDDNTKAGAHRFTTHVFKTDGDLMTGNWIDETGMEAGCILKPHLPAGYIGYHQFTGFMPSPGKSGEFMAVVALYNSSNVMNKLGWLEVNEDLSMIKFTLIDTVYSFTIASVPCVSCAFYKGEYLISVQQNTIGTGTGTPVNGKRIILRSRFKESGYTLHSTVFDLNELNDVLYPGSMMGQYIVNGSLFVYNSELYMFNSGAGTNIQEGNASKHCLFLWKYNDSEKTWSPVVSPVMVSTWGRDTNYPEIAGTFWGRDHVSHIAPVWLEDNKLYFGIQAAPGGGLGYHMTFGYWDLSIALK